MKTDLVEDAKTEFKEMFTSKVLKAVVAFSNTTGGTIYIGISDSGNIIGVDDQDLVSNSLLSSVRDNVRPSIIANIRIRTVKMDGKDVVVLEVPEGPSKPYYWKEKGLKEGSVYIRQGPTNVPAEEPIIREMIRESPTTPYEDLRSVKQDLTFKETTRILSANGLELKEEQMRSLGMIRDSEYTNLGYLLSDQCTQSIKASLFGDDAKVSFQDRGEFSGSLLFQLEKALEFIDKHNSRRSKIQGVRRIDSRDYPVEAVRECLINALVHRDYSLSGSILVEMYDDRMSVSSLGGLYKGLALDDLYLGVSSRRNEALAAIFYRLGLMESYGTGIPRIFGAYSGDPRKPKIELSTNVFKITLPKMTDEPLTEPSMRALQAFSDIPMGRSELEKEIGVSRMQALKIIDDLLSKGLIEQCGSGRSTKYVRH
jgi:ATP-dependent DNA helicase RecG